MKKKFFITLIVLFIIAALVEIYFIVKQEKVGSLSTNTDISTPLSEPTSTTSLLLNSEGNVSDNESLVTSTCSHLQEGKERDYCDADNAIEKGDSNICKLIPYESTRQYCIVNVNAKLFYMDNCKPSNASFRRSNCSKPFEKSDPQKTVFSQTDIETKGDDSSVNLLTFNYVVKSQDGAEGVVTVFFDDMVVYHITVESGDPGMKAQVPLPSEKIMPGKITPMKHKLTFRVDSFSAVKSDIEFSNVQINSAEHKN